MFSSQHHLIHLYLKKAQVRIALFWIVTWSFLYCRSTVVSVHGSTPISKESSGKDYCFVLNRNMLCFVQ